MLHLKLEAKAFFLVHNLSHPNLRATHMNFTRQCALIHSYTMPPLSISASDLSPQSQSEECRSHNSLSLLLKHQLRAKSNFAIYKDY